MFIPKIIHQLWIGPKPAPINLMNTWKEKHPDFEYIFWNEEEIKKRGILFECQEKINGVTELNGKADIMRWEILYKYGGVFIDADSICIEPIHDLLLLNKCFASYENEAVRGKGWSQDEFILGPTHPLIATGTMAFTPNHELPKLAIEWIKNNTVNHRRAWVTVGPGLLTRLFFSKIWSDIIILPSHYFLPIHHSGIKYTAHEKVYAYQEWGSTKNNYDTMNNISLPNLFIPPTAENSVSVLIPSHNTKAVYIDDCLKSIKNQIGHFNIELVWINDGSDILHTTLLKKLLEQFIKTTRFTSLVYHENETNIGVSASLNKGVLLCNNEIIIRMDSDDIMKPERIITQLEFMKKNPDIHICGAQILQFDNTGIIGNTSHKSYTWDEYIERPTSWFMNHPTLCFRKQSVIDVGNYQDYYLIEDLNLELRMLKKYKKIYNFDIPLLYYRIHPTQVTKIGSDTNNKQELIKIRNKMIFDLISSP